MAGGSTSELKNQGIYIVHLKKFWETKGAKILLFIVMVIVLFQVLELQNFLALYVPIPIIFSNEDSSSSSTSNNTPGFLSNDFYINPFVDSKDDYSNASSISNLVSAEEDRETKKKKKKKRNKKKRVKKVLEIVSMSDMEDLLSKNHVSPISKVFNSFSDSLVSLFLFLV